jgi:hypothetical protein
VLFFLRQKRRRGPVSLRARSYQVQISDSTTLVVQLVMLPAFLSEIPLRGSLIILKLLTSFSRVAQLVVLSVPFSFRQNILPFRTRSEPTYTSAKPTQGVWGRAPRKTNYKHVLLTLMFRKDTCDHWKREICTRWTTPLSL